MTLFVGTQRKNKVFLGNRKIKEIYFGSTLVYTEHIPSGTVLVYRTTPTSEPIYFTLNTKQKIRIQLVGAGAGTSVQNIDL